MDAEPSFSAPDEYIDKPMVVLEGEYDFFTTQSGEEVGESLSERAHKIGGIVDHDTEENTIRVRAWNVNGYFLLHYEPGEPIHEIETYDRDGNFVDSFTIEELIEHNNEMAKKFDLVPDSNIYDPSEEF